MCSFGIICKEVFGFEFWVNGTVLNACKINYMIVPVAFTVI